MLIRLLNAGNLFIYGGKKTLKYFISQTIVPDSLWGEPVWLKYVERHCLHSFTKQGGKTPKLVGQTELNRPCDTLLSQQGSIDAVLILVEKLQTLKSDTQTRILPDP